ncbi:MAG: nitrate transporter, partial [Alphaproteobacteria bacterium]|nr:nitrate transporter [Alphaproteobacteria bacterium]
DADLWSATAVFRPELYASAARSLGLSVPASTMKTEGFHRGRWLLPGLPTPIAMGSDQFLDGAVFVPVGYENPGR